MLARSVRRPTTPSDRAARAPNDNARDDVNAASASRDGAVGRPAIRPATIGSVHVVVLADTHAPRRWRVCPPRVAEHLRRADRILHAGDVCTAAVLAELAEYAPVTAVLGNNDGPDVAEWGAPRTAELDLDGLKVNMVHDSGAAAGRLVRLRRRFPGADLVVFGHSHIPLDESAPGLRIFNPGSPTDRRRQPHGTLGLLQIQDGRLITAAIVPVT
jgi:putative phosphoesterase